MWDYWLGVVLAIISGILNNLGSVLQKKVINEMPKEGKFFRSLVKNPTWILGFIIQMVAGSIFFMIAQIFIGPTLIPGLMAAGLIVLAIGSVKIVGEDLNKSEILGICIMILAITFLGFSNIDINPELVNFTNVDLILRMMIFTIISCVIMIFCYVSQKKFYKGIFLAILSGMCFVLSNFWISPLMGVMVRVLGGTAFLLELIIFVIAAFILVLTNIFGLSTIQVAFKEGQASNLIPIQQIPIQVATPFYFLFIFLLPPPNIFAMPMLIVGIGLVIISIFLLGKRQAEIEKIQ